MIQLGQYSNLVTMIDNKDFSANVEELNISKDTFSPSVAIIISIIDTENMVKKAVIKELSEIYISFETQTYNTFKATKTEYNTSLVYIERCELVRPNVYKYKLHLVSKYIIEDLNKLINISIVNKSLKEAIETINHYLPNLKINIDRDSDNRITCQINNKTPIAAMYYLLKHAHHNNKFDFLLYQIRNNEMRLKSFSDFSQSIHSLENKLNSVKLAETNIKDFIANSANTITNLIHGGYKSKYVYIDPFNKQVEDKLVEQVDRFVNKALIGLGSIEQIIAPANKFFDTVESSINNLTNRKQSLLDIDSNRLLVTLFSHNHFLDKLGEYVTLDINDHQDGVIGKSNPLYTGNHFLSSINLTIKPFVSCDMTLDFNKPISLTDKGYFTPLSG